jgi:hypothetical protein
MFANKNSRNIYTTLIPLFLNLKLLGLFPASFVGDSKNGNISRTLGDRVFFWIVYCLWIFSLVYVLNRPGNIVNFVSYSSSVLADAWDYTTAIGNCAILISMTYQYFKFERVLEVLVAFHKFDEKVKESNKSWIPLNHFLPSGKMLENFRKLSETKTTLDHSHFHFLHLGNGHHLYAKCPLLFG